MKIVKKEMFLRALGSKVEALYDTIIKYEYRYTRINKYC
jgi:hypothetical protein